MQRALLALLLLTLAPAAAPDAFAQAESPAIDMDRLVGAAIETRAALRDIDRQRAQATHDLRTRRGAAEAQARAFEDPAPDGRQVEAMTRELAALEAHLASVQAQIDRLKTALADARITDGAVREKRAGALHVQARALRAEEQAVAEPFQERMRAVRDAASADAALFGRAFEPYLRQASADGELVREMIVPSFANAFCAGHWAGGKGAGGRAASVFLQMTPDAARPAAPDAEAAADAQADAEAASLTQRFEVVFAAAGRMQVRAGHFEVTLLAKRDDLKPVQTMQRLLVELVDLEALAAIEPVGVAGAKAEQQKSGTAEN